MKNILEYKGYKAVISYEPGDRDFHGRVVNVSDTIHFSGHTPEKLEKAFHESVDDYLEFCREDGVAPEKPFSGRFVLRMDADTHMQLAALAAAEGKSLNAYCAEVLREKSLHAV